MLRGGAVEWLGWRGGRLRRLGRTIRATGDKSAATVMLANELDPLLGHVLSPAESTALYGRIAENVMAQPPAPAKVTKEDWFGALTSFVLVVVTSVPAAIPFLLMDDARLALRISNAILVALLFFTGYWWARYTLSKPWIAGLGFLVGGIVLVLTAIALGG